MKAAWFESFGPARDTINLGPQPKPHPLAGEVLVKLNTSGGNPSDVKKRVGAFPRLLDEGLIIPHSDGAGIIEAVGEGVSDDRTRKSSRLRGCRSRLIRGEFYGTYLETRETSHRIC
jgi:NADPH2:quinone reductase